MWAYDLQIHDKHLSWPVMSVEWGGETKRQNRLWPVLVYRLWVCVFLSVCVCWDNGIIEVLGVTGALMPGLLN